MKNKINNLKLNRQIFQKKTIKIKIKKNMIYLNLVYKKVMIIKI